MAVGETVSAMSSIANNAYLTVQPGSSIEWMISNIFANGAFETYMSDGTNRVLVDKGISSPFATALQKLFLTNTLYVQVKNVSGGTIYMGYSGIQIK